MAEPRIDSLLNELVDGGEHMSNRRERLALPVDNAIMRKITEQDLCTTASQAGRESRKVRNKGEETRITKRYALYGALSDDVKSLLGHRGSGQGGDSPRTRRRTKRRYRKTTFRFPKSRSLEDRTSGSRR